MNSLIFLTAHGDRKGTLVELRRWCERNPASTPFSCAAGAACAKLSQALFADAEAQNHPDLMALAFWLRPASLQELKRSFLAQVPEHCVAVPRGIALLFPPANVDSVFAYGWALAILTGNRAVIRLSDNLGTSGKRLLALMLAVLGEEPSHTLLLRSPHDDGLTTALNSVADLRVIWGGDNTVEHLRRLPTPPRCRDVTFPDRASLAALSLPSYAALTETERQSLAEAFYADSFTFDQMACSSPRLLAWVGPGDRAAASADLFNRLAGLATARGYDLPIGHRLTKKTTAVAALMDGVASAQRDYSPTVTVLEATGFHDLHPWTGEGLFVETGLTALSDLAIACNSRTQTLAVHGFTTEEVESFLTAVGSHAPDRIVPIGQALSFGPHWDGMDLLREFTRLVHWPRKEGNHVVSSNPIT